ncbi:MAG: transcription antitermination factor NusB [Bacteroidales bacterium]|nr:transcription antitermination factor NusB [Bacteroidales bacterium]
MLSRRHLRIKTLQALYAYFINDGSDLQIAEKNMLKSTERIYELAIYQLSFLVEIVKFAAKRAEENKKKFYPTPEDLNPNTKFIDNFFTEKLTENKDYLRRKNAYKINWVDNEDLIRRSYNDVRELDVYKKYMASSKHSFEEDKELFSTIFIMIAMENDFLESHYEEISVYWANDIDLANYCVLKIISSMNQNDDIARPLPPLYNADGKDDPEEDKKYMVKLFHKTILKSKDYEKIIEEKASNWDLSRITLMDVILLKMGLAELMEFPSIPIKVTMNEIIELAKMYSTPKSRVFINGVLDKMIIDLKESGQIVKAGRGLIE